MSVLPLKPCQKKKEKLQIWHITTHVEISAPHFAKDSSFFVQLQLICLSFCFSDVKAMTEIEGLGLTAPTMKMTKSKDKSFLQQITRQKISEAMWRLLWLEQPCCDHHKHVYTAIIFLLFNQQSDVCWEKCTSQPGPPPSSYCVIMIPDEL